MNFPKPKTLREAIQFMIGLNWALCSTLQKIAILENDDELPDSIRKVKQKTLADAARDITYDVHAAYNLFMKAKFGKYWNWEETELHNRYRNVLLAFAYEGVTAHVVQYDHIRAYGGAEEGGWYYDRYEDPTCVRSSLPYQKAVALSESLYENDKKFCSVNRTKRATFVEFIIGENETIHRPVYC